MRIRPRGLVNSGNLCFANAVLQVLVYCPPFWRFFTDLGRLLEPTEESKTPLVDATIRFVREFAPKERAPVEGKGKGVERYGSNGLVREEVDEDIMDSFMPTYVHDALKEKKRFDHMRVSTLPYFFRDFHSELFDRVDIKKTQKSSLDSTSTRSKKSS
jgi:ubiquitin carboxyl-terminal hydrolase 10